MISPKFPEMHQKTAKDLKIHLKPGREDQIQDPKLANIFKSREIIENAQHVGSDQRAANQQSQQSWQPEAFRDRWPKDNDQPQEKIAKNRAIYRRYVYLAIRSGGRSITQKLVFF